MPSEDSEDGDYQVEEGEAEQEDEEEEGEEEDEEEEKDSEGASERRHSSKNRWRQSLVKLYTERMKKPSKDDNDHIHGHSLFVPIGAWELLKRHGAVKDMLEVL